MRAAILKAPRYIKLDEIPHPSPQKGEVVVKLSHTGICGSDVHLFLGHRQLTTPGVLGHEGLGYIVELGKGVERKIGERVVIEPNIPCGSCTFCQAGRGNICPNKRVLGVTEHGCFSDFLAMPESFCWSIPDHLSTADAVTIEPMAVAYHALALSKAKAGDTILVIGLGAIGLLLTHLALRLGLEVWVMERSLPRLQLALDQGARLAEVNQLSKEITIVFECAGAPDSASLALQIAPRGSTVVLVGISEQPATFIPLRIVREGISILPSIIYDHPQDFKGAIDLINAGIISPGFIVSKYLPLGDIQNALTLASAGNEAKVVVEM